MFRCADAVCVVLQLREGSSLCMAPIHFKHLHAVFSLAYCVLTRMLCFYLHAVLLPAGELRVGTTTDFQGRPSVSWKHW